MALIPISANFAGDGSLQSQEVTLQNIAANFAGSAALNITWYLVYTKSIHYPAQIAISATFAGEGSLQVVIPESDVNMYMTTDPVNPGIYPLAGSDVLYRQAAGLEKAMADVDAGRLIATYAELVRDQWDPWAISYRNLGYLAWAMGVNLWEDDWSEQQRRQWVANQWTFKYYRGSDLGMQMAVQAVGATILNIVRPPALFQPGPALTAAERAAYLARFPQLRLYPYAPRPQLPWLNYMGGFSYAPDGSKIFVNNGHFFGPYKPFYPTNYNAGGLYLRACTLYDPQTGVETQLTVRTVTGVPTPGVPVTTYDEIQLPFNPGNLFFPGAGNMLYLVPPNTPLSITRRHGVILGRLPYEGSNLIRVPRDGSLSTTQYQAIFNTVAPGLKPIDVNPTTVSVVHPMRSTEFYCGQPLWKKFLPKSNAWQYIYEVWYLFDPTRLPDQRWARVYMGRARFGIQRYTAKLKIDASWQWHKAYAYAGHKSWIGPGRFFAPPDTSRIDQVRRAVTAAMALRDTCLIDTKVKRIIQLRDVVTLDGTYAIGQYITDSW